MGITAGWLELCYCAADSNLWRLLCPCNDTMANTCGLGHFCQLDFPIFNRLDRTPSILQCEHGILCDAWVPSSFN